MIGFISEVQEKGSNAAEAVRFLSPDIEIEEVLDVLNGKGKQAAKTGEGYNEVVREVSEIEGIRLQDDGRPYPRPMINEIRTDEQVIVGESEPSFDSDRDICFWGYDQVVESSGKDFSGRSLKEAAIEVAAENGYVAIGGLGDEVRWSEIGRQLDAETERVLYPSEFESISREFIERAFGEDVENESFSSYAERKNIDCVDEEGVLAETDPRVKGIYMVVSSETVDEYKLDSKEIDGGVSKLGVFLNQDSSLYTDVG